MFVAVVVDERGRDGILEAGFEPCDSVLESLGVRRVFLDLVGGLAMVES